jgi:dTDP-4-dehydrorhamnose 3,5-epimerase
LGRVLDVAVDLRVASPTFGKSLSIELSGEDKRQLFIPKGFAHGYVVLSKEAVFSYKVDNFYSSVYDSGVAWNDTRFGINWKLPLNEIVLSSKDKELKFLSEIDNPF